MGLLRRLCGTWGKRDKSSSSKQGSGGARQSRWSFIRSLDEGGGSRGLLTIPSDVNVGFYGKDLGDLDPNKHAIAVAAATAAVAEAALAAAQAAVEVVRLTSGGRRGYMRVEELAAVKIQSAFRGYLARRALRALKALVKLQALVRGHIVRKQMADMLRRIQTLVRLQARARASRSSRTLSSHARSKSSLSHQPRCGSISNLRGSHDMEEAKFGSNWLDRWMEESVSNNHHGDASYRYRHDGERNAKILEVDTWKPHLNSPKNHGIVNSYRAIDSPYIKGPYPMPSSSSEEITSLRSLHSYGVKGDMLRSVDDSPQVVSVSSRPGSSSSTGRGPFAPAKSECGWGSYIGYSGHPNYMSDTESSRAKLRSQSAPKQRLEVDGYGLSKRGALPPQSSWETASNSERGYPINADRRKKAASYTVSNRLDRLRSSNTR